MDVSGSSGNDIVGFKHGDNLKLKFGEATFTARPNKPTAGKFQTIRYIEKGSEKEYYISSKTFDRLGLAAGKESKVTLYARESKKLGKSQMKVSLTPPSVRHRTTESTNDVSKKIFAPSQKQIDAKALKKQEVGQLAQTHDKLTEELSQLDLKNPKQEHITSARASHASAKGGLKEVKKAKGSTEYKQVKKDIAKLSTKLKISEKQFTKNQQKQQCNEIKEEIQSYFDQKLVSTANQNPDNLISKAEKLLADVPLAKKSSEYREAKEELKKLKKAAKNTLKIEAKENRKKEKIFQATIKEQSKQPVDGLSLEMIKEKRTNLKKHNAKTTEIFIAQANKQIKRIPKKDRAAAKAELKSLEAAAKALQGQPALESGSNPTDAFLYIRLGEIRSIGIPTSDMRDAYLNGNPVQNGKPIEGKAPIRIESGRLDADYEQDATGNKTSELKEGKTLYYDKDDFDEAHEQFNALPQERKQELIDLGWGFLAAPPHSGKESSEI